MYKIIILLLTSLLVFSCVKMSAITPVGKDTYMLASSSNSPQLSGGQLKAKLAQKASMFCAEDEKLMMIVDSSTSDYPGASATAEITFRCLFENAPEYIRSTPENKNSP